MSNVILTSQAAIRLYNETTGLWGGYSDPKNLMGLEIAKPEPTQLKDYSSAPDDTFASVIDQTFIPKGQATIKLSTKDLVNRNSLPNEFLMLAVALGASVGAYTKAVGDAVYFTAVVDQMELNFDTNDRNIVASSVVVHKEVADSIGGLHTGRIASVADGVYTVTAAGWTVDALITGAKLMITGGAGKGQVVAITDNDATTITATLSPVADNTSTFALVATSPLTKDVDYTVDTRYGTIKPLTSGSVVKDDILHGFVDSLGITGTRYRGAIVTNVTFGLRGRAKDIKSGAEGWLNIPKIIAYSSAAQQFVANAESPEYKTLELTGDLMIETGFSEPYTFDNDLVYATT